MNHTGTGKTVPSEPESESESSSDSIPSEPEAKPKSSSDSEEAMDVDNDDATAGDDDGEFMVETILDHKFKCEKMYFKIRWKNLGADQDTWELKENFSCPKLFKRYIKEHPTAAPKKTPTKQQKVSRF